MSSPIASRVLDSTSEAGYDATEKLILAGGASKLEYPGVNYCQGCGDRLGSKVVEGQERPHCASCRSTVFMDPKVAVVVLVSMDGGIVLIRRAIEPALGGWSFPAGYVDRGEVVEEAAAREVIEETGLTVKVSGLVDLISFAGETVILAVYAAEVIGGALTAGSDSTEVRVFDPDELPALAFPHDIEIVARWRNWTGRSLTAQEPL
ncbi:MAG: NUDIX domain-containing protein [Chloroflexi bacterium]|nr:NUDIX domain-containing protein [Chloroflexota bacterium]